MSRAKKQAITIPAIAPAPRPDEELDEVTTTVTPLLVVTPVTEVAVTPVTPLVVNWVLNLLVKPVPGVADAKNVPIAVAVLDTSDVSVECVFTLNSTLTPALRVEEMRKTSWVVMVYVNWVVAQDAIVIAKELCTPGVLNCVAVTPFNVIFDVM